MIKNMSFSYSKAPFFESMNFSVDSGEIFGFLGPSGSGKSALQKILIGLLSGYRGSIVTDFFSDKRDSQREPDEILIKKQYK